MVGLFAALGAHLNKCGRGLLQNFKAQSLVVSANFFTFSLNKPDLFKIEPVNNPSSVKMDISFVYSRME